MSQDIDDAPPGPPNTVLIGTDSDGLPVAWLALSNDMVRLSDRHLAALAHGISGEAVQAAEAKENKAATLPAGLVDHGVLGIGKGETSRMPAYWTSPEAVVHFRASLGGPRCPTAFAPVPEEADSPITFESNHQPIKLAPVPGRADRIASILGRRRSSRMVCEPVALPDLVALLELCCGPVQDEADPNRLHRPYPTAGGADELTLLVIVSAVPGLRAGVYRHDSDRGMLLPIADPPATEFAQHNISRARLYLGLPDGSTPAVLLIIDAIWPHLLRRYTDVGMISAYCDAGALLQTMYLVAADLGLACTAVSSMSALRNAELLNMDPLKESQVACFAIGGGPPSPLRTVAPL
jgi:SagB-type dehydrogenase family enzyme